jgi:hypothetical protein
VKLPSESTGVRRALEDFQSDADMLGTSLFGYAKHVVREVISVGRSGTLVDWEGVISQFTQFPRMRICEPASSGDFPVAKTG